MAVELVRNCTPPLLCALQLLLLEGLVLRAGNYEKLQPSATVPCSFHLLADRTQSLEISVYSGSHPTQTRVAPSHRAPRVPPWRSLGVL